MPVATCPSLRVRNGALSVLVHVRRVSAACGGQWNVHDTLFAGLPTSVACLHVKWVCTCSSKLGLSRASVYALCSDIARLLGLWALGCLLTEVKLSCRILGVLGVARRSSAGLPGTCSFRALSVCSGVMPLSERCSPAKGSYSLPDTVLAASCNGSRCRELLNQL